MAWQDLHDPTTSIGAVFRFIPNVKKHRAVEKRIVDRAAGRKVALAFFVVPAITDSGEQASAKQPLQLIYYDGHMHTTLFAFSQNGQAGIFKLLTGYLVIS